MDDKLLVTYKKNRPTFYYKNNSKNQIRAGGLIFYRFTDDMKEPEYLMIKSQDKYEDFGGKTDLVDKCYQDTVLRETEEESNGILNLNHTFDYVMNSTPVYYQRSKYVTYLIKTEINYKPDDFGEKEYHDNIPRTVEWVSHSKLISSKFTKKKLHTRLLFKEFFDKLRDIHYVYPDNIIK
jgi:hypothetical protein